MLLLVGFMQIMIQLEFASLRNRQYACFECYPVLLVAQTIVVALVIVKLKRQLMLHHGARPRLINLLNIVASRGSDWGLQAGADAHLCTASLCLWNLPLLQA